MKNATEYTAATDAKLEMIMNGEIARNENGEWEVVAEDENDDWFAYIMSDEVQAQIEAEAARKQEKKNADALYAASIKDNARQLYDAHRCRRCSGNGCIAAYSHIANGVCYRCGGRGFTGISLAKFEILKRQAGR